MPIHDWRRVDAGLFHAFHHWWSTALCDALNSGLLSSDYFAIPEQHIRGLIQRNEVDMYAAKANRITVRHRHGDVVAVIEIVSPGNKGGRAEFSAFVEKSVELIRQGVHLLMIDPFPPGRRDPQRIHKAIWDEFEEVDCELPPDKPLTVAAYDAGPPRVAYVEPVAVGDALPDMPLFLRAGVYVPAPLEATYQVAWNAFPDMLKRLLEAPPPQPE